MHNFIFKVRSQCRKLIFGIERSRKSTKRPHIFPRLRMTMLGRDEHHSRTFEWPASFRDVFAEHSCLREELQKMLSARMAQKLAHGAASFTIPVATVKRSQRDVTHAVEASGGVATHGENDKFEDGDVEFGSLSGEKGRGGGGGGKPPVAKPSTDVAPMLKWGNAYQPADVNMQPGDSLNRTQWIEARTFWLSRTNGFLYIACRAQLTLGVAIWRSVGRSGRRFSRSLTPSTVRCRCRCTRYTHTTCVRLNSLRAWPRLVRAASRTTTSRLSRRTCGWRCRSARALISSR